MLLSLPRRSVYTCRALSGATLVAGCAAALVLGAVPAAAQAGIGVPGGGQGLGVGRPQRRVMTNPLWVDPDGPKMLVLTFGAFGSYDNNQVTGLVVVPGSTGTTTTGTSTTSADPTATTTTTPYFWRSGLVGGGNIGLDFNKSWAVGTQGQISSTAFSNINMFTRRQDPLFAGGVGFSESVPLGTRWAFSSSQTVRYQPFFGFGVFPGFNNVIGAVDTSGALDPTLINAVAPTSMFTGTLNARLSYRMTRRGSLNFGYFLNANSFTGNSNQPFVDQMFNVGYGYQLSRYLSLSLGYGYGRTNNVSAFTGTRPSRHNINIGVNSGLGRAFPIAPGLTIGFNTGTSMLANQTRSGAGFGSAQFGNYTLRLTGNAFVRKDLGRTWSASATYYRGWNAVVGFGDPFFMDSVMANIGGSLTRRLSAGAQAGYVNGSIGAVSSTSYRAFTSNATLRFHPTPWLVTYAQYVNYRLTLPSTIQLPTDFPSELRRQSSRVGLSLQVPLF